MRTFQRDLQFLRRERGLRIVYQPAVSGYRIEEGPPPRERGGRPDKGRELALFQLVHILRSDQAMTVRQLATAIGCGTGAVYRCLAELERLHFPLVTRSGYRLAPQAFHLSLGFSPEELLVVLLGLDLLDAEAGGAAAPVARRTREKIVCTLQGSLSTAE